MEYILCAGRLPGHDGHREEVLPILAAQLVQEYGRSFAEKNLRRMVQLSWCGPHCRVNRRH